MSTILKALRRLEEDRQPPPAENLHESVTAPSTPRHSNGRRIAWGVALLLALGASAGAGVWLSRFVGERETTLAAAPVVSPAVSSEPAAPTPMARSAREPVRRRSAPIPVARAAPAPSTPETPPARVASAAQAPESPPAEIVPVPAPKPARSPTATVRKRAPASDRAGGPASVREPVPAPERARTAVPVPAPVPEPDEPLVEVVERAPAPTLGVVVARTVWHPKRDRRTALVRETPGGSTRRVRVGDSLGGWEVLEIEPSRVLFHREGVEIHRRVGER